MTEDQKEIITSLNRCKYFPGSWDKRFVKNIANATTLTDKQAEWILRLLYKYRKQNPVVYKKHEKNPLCSYASERNKPAIIIIEAPIIEPPSNTQTEMKF